MLSLWMP
ncbi:hypothetical protein CVT25_014151 [Psilocybe cyanescens]|nr:hypothetical protein CVT25_014151 [Psilocybe cyanescens]